jgi:hypothetical protein
VKLVKKQFLVPYSQNLVFGSFLRLGHKVLTLSEVTARTDSYLTTLTQLYLSSAVIAANDRRENVGRDMKIIIRASVRTAYSSLV